MHKKISFAEPERLSEIFDSENREEWQNTSFILETLGLKPNAVIADVGAGTGYFSNLFALQVTEGKVYAMDAELNMVGYMEDRFANGFTNITVLKSELDDPCIPEDTDVVFLANVYRFIQQRDEFLSRMLQQVDQKTEIVFVDFKGANARVSPQQAAQEVESAGFRVTSMDLENCPDHYVMKFCKQPLS